MYALSFFLRLLEAFQFNCLFIHVDLLYYAARRNSINVEDVDGIIDDKMDLLFEKR